MWDDTIGELWVTVMTLNHGSQIVEEEELLELEDDVELLELLLDDDEDDDDDDDELPVQRIDNIELEPEPARPIHDAWTQPEKPFRYHHQALARKQNALDTHTQLLQ